MRTKHGPGGMLSSPLVGLRPLSMLRLEDCHYFAISAQSETFERIVYTLAIFHFLPPFSLLYFSPIRPMFMKNHSHNAHIYTVDTVRLWWSPLSKKGHVFFSFSFFLSFFFTIDLVKLRGFSSHPVNSVISFFFLILLLLVWRKRRRTRPRTRTRLFDIRNFCTLSCNDYDGIVWFVERDRRGDFDSVEYSDIYFDRMNEFSRVTGFTRVTNFFKFTRFRNNCYVSNT